jgi:hypothetical protein
LLDVKRRERRAPFCRAPLESPLTLGKLTVKKEDLPVPAFNAACQLLQTKKAASKQPVKGQLTLMK